MAQTPNLRYNNQNAFQNQFNMQMTPQIYQQNPQYFMAQQNLQQAHQQSLHQNSLQENDPQKQLQKQKQNELRNHYLSQIEEKQKLKELQQLLERKKQLEEDERIIKEREEIEKRQNEQLNKIKLNDNNKNNFIVTDKNNQNQKNQENLEITHKSNFKNTKTQNQSQMQSELSSIPNTLSNNTFHNRMESYNFTDISGTNFSNTKISNPNNTNEAIFYEKKLLKTEKERFLTERKIIKELPIQIEFQVKEVLNHELQKMKDELDQYQNNMGLQINNIKGQINRTNEEKSSIENHLQNLKYQIKKTQQDDIKRQREILNQFVFNQKQNDIYSLNTRKINEGEEDDLQQIQQQKFQFPTKPRPYYNLNDPKLESFHLQHNHQPLHNSTSVLSVNNIEPSQALISNAQDNSNLKHVPRIKHQQYYNGINLDKDLDSNINIPEDHKNRQNLKYYVDSNDIDVQNILRKNQNRLEDLQEINLENNMAELDAQLFNQVVENERYH